MRIAESAEQAQLRDEELRQSMGRAAREKMVKEYDIKERVRVLEELYDSVIENHAAR